MVLLGIYAGKKWLSLLRDNHSSYDSRWPPVSQLGLIKRPLTSSLGSQSHHLTSIFPYKPQAEHFLGWPQVGDRRKNVITYLFIFTFILAVLRFELRGSQLLGWHFTTWTTLAACNLLFINTVLQYNKIMMFGLLDFYGHLVFKLHLLILYLSCFILIHV
jgi:hypothetical protein